MIYARAKKDSNGLFAVVNSTTGHVLDWFAKRKDAETYAFRQEDIRTGPHHANIRAGAPYKPRPRSMKGEAMPGDNLPGGRDTKGHSSVQAWSHGEIFPAVIVIVDSHDDAGNFRYRAYDLRLDGQTERFATHEDAEAAARYLLADPVARSVWTNGEG